MKRILLLALAPLAIPVPVTAQTMDHSNMPGMQMPAPKKPAAKPAPRRQPAAQPRQRRGAPHKPAPPPAHAGHAGPARPAETEIGRAHVCTPVTTAHLVCRLLLGKKTTTTNTTYTLPKHNILM